MNFFEGADKPWNVPFNGWHHDGSHFRHYIDSPEQGLLQLCFFSEVSSRGGAPLIIEDSHHVVAHVLKDYPEGLDLGEALKLEFQHPYLTEMIHSQDYSDSKEIAAKRITQYMNKTYKAEGFDMRVVEAVGGPGDVILGHPFIIHNSSQNQLRKPRFLSTRTVPLKEPMNLSRINAKEYSPLELSTIRAMG